MLFRILYSEYMEYEEDIEAVSSDEAKRQFEEGIRSGTVEPTSAKVFEYKAEPTV